MNWRPIETAPGNQWVLGYFPDDPWSNVWTVKRSDEGHYSSWFGDHYSSSTANEKVNPPTHWMPLPEPPSS